MKFIDTEILDIYYSYLSERLDYNKETGQLIWNDRSHHVYKGKAAGFVNSRGYLQICTKPSSHPIKKNVLLHRFVWWIFNGHIPEGMLIDHIDGDKTNNRIENLRVATPSENAQNCSKPKNNTSGVMGVQWVKKDKRWLVVIRKNFKPYYFGYYKDFELAELVAEEARQMLHGDFATKRHKD